MLKLKKHPGKILEIITLVLSGAVLYSCHSKGNAPATAAIVRQPLDGATASQVMALDKQNDHATFVFVNDVPGVAKMRNKVIMLPPIGDDLRINFDEYLHKGHDGPLYIILPDRYAGPKEKFVLKAFPDYKGWYGSMISQNFVMYAAK